MKLATMLAAALAAAVITTAVAFGSTAGGNPMPIITVTMDGSSIVVTGTLLSGAVDVHTVASGGNSGTPIFVRLNNGVTADEFLTFINSTGAADPNAVADYGSIVFDAEAGQGTNDVQTILQPGDYVALDGTSHDPSQWPNTTFTIDENPSPVSLPAPDQWQKSIEFRFRGPKTLYNGQVIRASNIGWLVHMDFAIQVKNQAAGREVAKLLRAGKNPPAKLFGPNFFSLFDPVSHGAVQQFVLQAQPGWYVEACFMDTQDGREHTKLGMERVVHVVNP